MGPTQFVSVVDALLDDNATLLALAVVLIGAHLAIAVLGVARRRIPRLAGGLNLAIAASILLYKTMEYWAYPALTEEALDDLTGNSDVRLILFEALVAVAAGFAFARWRVAAALSAAAFLVHALAIVALLTFALTFHLDRLI
jgi:hypothetical protein